MSLEDVKRILTEKVAKMQARKITGSVVLKIEINQGGISSEEVVVTEKEKIK